MHHAAAMTNASVLSVTSMITLVLALVRNLFHLVLILADCCFFICNAIMIMKLQNSNERRAAPATIPCAGCALCLYQTRPRLRPTRLMPPMQHAALNPTATMPQPWPPCPGLVRPPCPGLCPPVTNTSNRTAPPGGPRIAPAPAHALENPP